MNHLSRLSKTFRHQRFTSFFIDFLPQLPFGAASYFNHIPPLWQRAKQEWINSTRVPLLFLVLFLLAGCTALPAAVDPASDAPDRHIGGGSNVPHPASYAEALAAWRGPEDLSAWIAALFAYDMDRAVALAESQRADGSGPRIIEPAAFYARPVGVCIDLARFAVTTLKHIAPELRARYLMLEFAPARIRGQVMRRHWVASYDTPDGIMVMADSKRPGAIVGPYESIEAFLSEYATYRNREIVSYRETDSYGRKARQRAKRKNGGVMH